MELNSYDYMKNLLDKSMEDQEEMEKKRVDDTKFFWGNENEG